MIRKSVAASYAIEPYTLTGRHSERLLLRRIRGEGDRAGNQGGGCFRENNHFPHHNCFANRFAMARDGKAEPDAESREQDSYERAIKLHGVLNDDEAVFGVLERGDEETADHTEDENVAL